MTRARSAGIVASVFATWGATACTSNQVTTQLMEPDAYGGSDAHEVADARVVLADETVVDASAADGAAVDAQSSPDAEEGGCSSCEAGVETCASGAGCNASFWACSVSEGVGLSACALVCTCDAGAFECNQDCPPDAAPPMDCVQDVACIPGVRCGGDPPVCLCDDTGHLQCPPSWDGGAFTDQ